LTEELKTLLPTAIKDSGRESEQSLHAIYGGKHADYIDIKNEVITSPDHFVSLYLSGFKDAAEKNPDSAFKGIDKIELARFAMKVIPPSSKLLARQVALSNQPLKHRSIDEVRAQVAKHRAESNTEIPKASHHTTPPQQAQLPSRKISHSPSNHSPA